VAKSKAKAAGTSWLEVGASLILAIPLALMATAVSGAAQRTHGRVQRLR
jgi:hypothetical protein